MDIYVTPGSPPCRAVVMAAKTMGINFNKKLVNLQEGEQLNAEFVKLNPQHTVPTIVDNGFAVWESRAILVYLAQTYGKYDTLYPRVPQEQALVNQRLFFDMGVLMKSFSDYYYPVFKLNKPADPEQYKTVEAAFEYLNTFLEGQVYVAGPNLTIADISILATVATFDIMGFKISDYINVAKWYANAQKEVAGWDEDWAELQTLKAQFEKKA